MFREHYLNASEECRQNICSQTGIYVRYTTTHCIHVCTFIVWNILTLLYNTPSNLLAVCLAEVNSDWAEEIGKKLKVHMAKEYIIEENNAQIICQIYIVS